MNPEQIEHEIPYNNIMCPNDCGHVHHELLGAVGSGSSRGDGNSSSSGTGASSGNPGGGSSSGGSSGGSTSGARNYYDMRNTRGRYSRNYSGNYSGNYGEDQNREREFGFDEYGGNQNFQHGNRRNEAPYRVFVEASMPPKHESMKEQTTGSPIINMLPDGGGRCGYNGDALGGLGALAGILPLALLAPLFGLGRGGFGGGWGGEGGGRSLEAVIAEQIGDVRHDIGAEAIASLKESFAADKDALRAGFAAELAGVKAGFESKLETERAINQIENKIGECCAETSGKFCALEKQVDDKFCSLKDEMLKGFAAVKEREILDELRIERERNAQLHETIRDRALLTDILTSIGVTSPIMPLAKTATTTA